VLQSLLQCHALVIAMFQARNCQIHGVIIQSDHDVIVSLYGCNIYRNRSVEGLAVEIIARDAMD
jgi:hypothetical protein